MDEMEAWMAEAGLTDSVKDTIRAVANGMSTTNVNLNAAGLQDKGTKALAIALNIRPNNDIRVLYLDGNSIGKEGCVALAGALRGHTGLQTLYLGNNSIEKEGCVALAGALCEHTWLQTLWLEGIGKDAARAFGVKWPMESNYCLILTNSERRAFDEGQRVQDQDKVQQAQNGNDTAVPRPLSREEIERLQRDMQEEDQQLQRKGEEIERLQRIIQEKDQQLQRKEERLRQLEDQAESFFNLNLDPARFTTKKRVRDNKGNPVKGAFGKLYRSTLAGHDVALKEVDDVEERPRLQQLLTEMYSTTTSDGDSKRVLREVAVLASLRHPNIVPFLGLCYDNDHNTLSFVLSWAENGSLYDYTHVHKKNLSDVDKLRILSEVAAAMEFLHAHNVVHRDLKSPNVLLDASLSAKVTDFGLSAFVSEDASTMTHVRGTRFWESPEQLFGHDIRADTDVFSFGCVVWEVWFGVVPWHHGPYSRGGITQASLGIRYSNLEYLPLDAEINGRRLTSALQALLCVCFDASGNRVDFSQLHAALKSQQRAARDQEADDLREQHMLLHGPPDAVWKFPQQLLAAVDATQLSTRQSVHIAPLQLDEDAVTELVHAAGGRTAEQNPREPFGRTLCRVAITWCDQKLVAFNGALHRNTTRYRGHLTSASHPFAPKYDHDTTTGQATVAEERAVLERVTRVGVYSMLDPSLLPKDPPLRIQRVFHGVGSFDAVLGILGGDFAQLQKTDKGWYGAGFYFTPDLDYACAYAQPCTVSADHDNVPPDLHCLNLEPGKSYRIVLACDVMYGNPYPVKQTSVHPMLQAIPVQQLPTPRWRSFIGLPLVAGHDAHVAVVDFTSGKVKAALPFETHSQWTQGDNVPAAEIVVTDPSCVLVRAVLVFEA